MINIIKRFVRSNDALHLATIRLYMVFFFRISARRRARKFGLTCTFSNKKISVHDGNKEIRIGKSHAIYFFDIIDNFNFFFDAVKPVQDGPFQLVDYSLPRLHQVNGFDLHPILFPSIAEPIETTKQYLAFAQLTEGSLAIDIGAYSGLTSIMFREECGATGRVIAIEADQRSIAAARQNFDLYETHTGRQIELVEGAVWSHNDGIIFSTEGSMGSSASVIVGNRTGVTTRVPSFTLAKLAERLELDRVDFIKCDIEGGEAMIFDDAEFFSRYRPRIMVEAHVVAGKMTTDIVTKVLSRHGYNIRRVEQDGINYPILECCPN